VKIGLDVDGVLANFPMGVIDRARTLGLSATFPTCCHEVDHWDMSPAFKQVMRDAWLDIGFWLKLKPLPTNVEFQPDCYITSRPIDSWVTEQWLGIHGFPKAPVITVPTFSDKLQHVVDRGLDIFVDDYFATVEMLLNAGLKAVLFKAPYQRGHVVDHLPTIESLDALEAYA
jgi:hypothetical protein